MIHDGYVESCTFSNITLFCLLEDDQDITALEVANRFKFAVKQYLEEEKYPEDITKMFSWDTDMTGSLWEFVEGQGFYFNIYEKCPITKVIYIDNIIDFITDEENWFFEEENYNQHTGQPSCFNETILT